MIIRSNNDDVTIWQDAITMALRRAKWTHKSVRKWAFARTSVNFLHAKDFAFAHKVAAEAWKIQPAVTRWVKMASRMTRCFHDQTRIWKFSYSCVHLLSNSERCDASISVRDASASSVQHPLVPLCVCFEIVTDKPIGLSLSFDKLPIFICYTLPLSVLFQFVLANFRQFCRCLERMKTDGANPETLVVRCVVFANVINDRVLVERRGNNNSGYRFKLVM